MYLTLKSLSQCDAKERELSNLAIIFKKAYYDLTGARKQYFKQKKRTKGLFKANSCKISFRN